MTKEQKYIKERIYFLGREIEISKRNIEEGEFEIEILEGFLEKQRDSEN